MGTGTRWLRKVDTKLYIAASSHAEKLGYGVVEKMHQREGRKWSSDIPLSLPFRLQSASNRIWWFYWTVHTSSVLEMEIMAWFLEAWIRLKVQISSTDRQLGQSCEGRLDIECSAIV